MKMTHIKTPQLPSGIEDFAEMRLSRLFPEGEPLAIADKTGFLPNILDFFGDLMVFTRPIRFMKSSTLSMIDRFISIGDAEANRTLFDGLAINDEAYADFRAQYQGQFPVILLTLKNIKADTWSEAKKEFSDIIADLYEKHSYVLNALKERQKDKYQRLLNGEGEYSDLKNSLAELSSY